MSFKAGDKVILVKYKLFVTDACSPVGYRYKNKIGTLASNKSNPKWDWLLVFEDGDSIFCNNDQIMPYRIVQTELYKALEGEYEQT